MKRIQVIIFVMSTVFTCTIDKDSFIDDRLYALSPFFDLETLVDAERKCKDNIFERDNTQKADELSSIITKWNTATSIYFIISGRWLRQWAFYILVCHTS